MEVDSRTYQFFLITFLIHKQSLDCFWPSNSLSSYLWFFFLNIIVTLSLSFYCQYFQQSERSFFNCLGEKKVKHPKVIRRKPKIAPKPNDRIIWPDADAVQEKG